MTDQWMAACGLDCEECSIRRIPFDRRAADECTRWFRNMGWLEEGEGVSEIIDRGMYCNGCKGDRSIHWSVSADGDVECWILDCCVDRRGLESCAACVDFPCDRLTEWSKQNAEYSGAYARLQRISREDAPA